MSDRISVIEFLAETKDDVNSPTTSTFTSKMSLCRATIAALEEASIIFLSALKKMKNSTKAMYNSGLAQVSNESNFIENLEKLGAGALYNSKEPEPDIGSAFLKLAVFTKELSSLFKNLVSNISNIIMFPLESLLKGDLKGIKGDMKRPFDKSWKDYDTKVKQVEREKRQLAKDAGMIRNEITGAEIAEEMEKERRMFQLQMCDYLIKANEIKTKKGVDLLQHLVEFYHAQNTFFTDGYKVIEHFRAYAEDLTSNLHSLRQAQDEERRQLVELKTILKTSVSDPDNTPSGKSQANVYNLHQLQGNKELGTEKAGYLMKRSEGLRKAWQKRKCIVAGGFLTISHNNMNKAPVKLNLLTSQLKLVSEDKKQFDLVAHNRTYRFMAEDDNDAVAWVSVITNSKEDALNRVFGDAAAGKDGNEQNPGLRELTQSVIDEVRRLPGNDRCCDCNAPEPTWLSTNLGVLLCIECSGIHRDMGVHVSRIQSITLDDLGTSELLLARSVGNDNFNDIMEDKLENEMKPTPSSNMEERKSFIRGKYISRKYVVHTCADDPDALTDELGQAIRSCDVFSLLQLWAEGADMCAPLPGYDDAETALHVAVSMPNHDCSGTVLPLVDFLAQNIGSGMNKKTISGNTALHICAEMNQTECMKLLLRSKASPDLENARGETALQITRRVDHPGCEEILEQAASGKFRSIVHINIDWNLTFNDEDDFISDDDLDDKALLPLPQQLMGMSPSKTNNNSGDSHRHRPTSFKERTRPLPDVPPPPPRGPPPVVPQHASAAVPRARSHTAAPGSMDARKSGIEGRPPAPAIPNKPDLPLKSTPRSSSLVTANLYPLQVPTNDGRRESTPEIPLKSVTSLRNTRFASFGGKRRKSRQISGLKPGQPGSIEKSRSLPRNSSPSDLRPDPNRSDAPVPLPRSSQVPPPTPRPRRVRAIYDCEADNQDELTFVENEIIVVTGVEDQDWWVGHVEHQPHRVGVFPVSFVHILSDGPP
ncbi:zinc finger protein Ci-ArfGAP-11 [Ciona intestinalis]